ncbi:alpha/beta hydrolase [Paenibacillus aurantius]|uniref:Alpha/beta hydrolase n=1 Tax=Paenibacillus aurantius TaxID=2918900 RepID=A0AA96LL33_9BACL|nr:alpha/beta hydrolase [Paenibacillus aurantius]WNQ14071.1 alpha/beta hydrolase [Paenibacillus aurantius]
MNDSVKKHPLPVNGCFYSVEGRQLFLHRSGTGTPAVVFIPAAGMIGLDYDNIHRRISKSTTSVIYDRAGTGWSDPVKLPRSAAEVTNELRSLLHTAGVPAPYLFVGHSLGGLYACRYAQSYPDEVAGMLLLEPPHEDFLSHTPKLKKRHLPQQAYTILRTALTYKRTFRRLFDRMFEKWPDSVRQPLVEYHLRTLSSTMTERKNLNNKLYQELREGGDLPDVPLIVVTGTGIDPFLTPVVSSSFLRESMEPFTEAKKTIYTRLARSVPQGEHRLFPDAGHTTIHTDSPDEVVEAIETLLGHAGHG